MPPKKRAKKTFTFPVVNKHFDRYVGRTIQVADKWWDEKVFSIDDSRTLCIVEEHEPSHQFPHKARCHAFAIRVLDPLNAVERANAEPLEDPDHFKRLYWMDIKTFSQFHNETYPDWNISTFRDDVTVEIHHHSKPLHRRIRMFRRRGIRGDNTLIVFISVFHLVKVWSPGSSIQSTV